jgi:hypothetical protein
VLWRASAASVLGVPAMCVAREANAPPALIPTRALLP